jgi:hypothetical protein
VKGKRQKEKYFKKRFEGNNEKLFLIHTMILKHKKSKTKKKINSNNKR